MCIGICKQFRIFSRCVALVATYTWQEETPESILVDIDSAQEQFLQMAGRVIFLLCDAYNEILCDTQSEAATAPQI